MIIRKLILILILFFCILTKTYSIEYDTLFIIETKTFIFNQFGTILNGNFYTEWDNYNKPNLLLFVSLSFKVEKPGRNPGNAEKIHIIDTTSLKSKERITDSKSKDIYFGDIWSMYTFDEERIKSAEIEYQKLGFQTFCYKSYCNASTTLNKRFFEYSYESKSFIMFHELLHNFFIHDKIKIPYQFNEAACDIIGNYGTLNYLKLCPKLQVSKVNKMIEVNEKAYEIMNKYISMINLGTDDTEQLCDECNNELYKLKENYDYFQIDRFYYAVNTAYLLKNINYCKEYFLLKQVFQKTESIKDFLEILKKVPEDVLECENYFKKLL